MIKLTDEQVSDLRAKHGWAKETIRAIEAEVLRLNGGGGEAVPPFGERTPSVMTYKDQPGNVGAWRLGEACGKAAAAPAGDYIDRGLVLLRELQAKGYGVVHLAAPKPPEPA